MFQLPSGKWKAQMSYRDTAGKRHRKSRTQDSHADAVAALRKLHEECGQAVYSEASTLTVKSYLTEWLERVVRTERASGTYNNYHATCQNHLIPRLGRLRLKNLAPIHVDSLMADLARDKIGHVHERMPT